MDGFEATRRIRKLVTGHWMLDTSNQHPASSDQLPASSDQHPVIIAISASAFEQTKERSIAAGCHDFLAKPISKQSLLDKLQIYLRLEWIYEADISDFGFRISDLRSSQVAICKSQSKIHSDTHLAEESIIPPPMEELTLLNELAMIGDIMELRERIEAIDNLDPQFAPFAAKVRKLARDLNILEIQRFLKPYLR
jgi:hypothetical protein